ncbi:MAG TPA: GNAT family N-acetyltransferase, partial [Pirellulales bacterium]
LTSLDALRGLAAAWDELWLRSDAPAPTCRAETAAQWVETFAPGARLCIPVVLDGPRPVAAMLLAGRRLRGPLELGMLAINDWCDCGDLLLDPAARTDEALDLMVQGLLDHARWPLIRLEAIALDQPRWQSLVAAAERAGLGLHAHPDCQVGRVLLPAEWRQYEAGWSANHRRHMRRAERRALADGPLELRAYENPTGPQLRELLERGFEIEDRSWKGAAGTSVRKHAQLAEFLVRHAEQLAAWQQLVLVFLEHHGQAIAFELGHVAKGVYFSTKVGYDPAFADYTPGQLLRLLWLRRLHAEGAVRVVDFWGPLVEATAKWSNQSYRAGRITIAMPGFAGRGLLALYSLARRARRSFAARGEPQGVSPGSR